jgi:hypothetical protein
VQTNVQTDATRKRKTDRPRDKWLKGIHDVTKKEWKDDSRMIQKSGDWEIKDANDDNSYVDQQRSH